MTDSRQEQISTSPRAGWILYDGKCGFCYIWVHFWESVIERRGFVLKDLQSAAAEGMLQTSSDSLLDDIRVLTSHGEVKSGAHAYLLCDTSHLVGVAVLRGVQFARI
ncbi:MAG TPA: DCC1-like thiol-disulfide oxidoreductase family protein [Candidatus Acidoferrales bacterium]|nr:DCC1-like thiol-disulfide oxidoreductase family protein [Candidatus Acidoferrales bacterium]